MARNINLKLSNLKINTNIEHLYEAKTPLNANVRKTQVNTASPKKSNYNSIIGHGPSLSLGLGSNSGSNSKYFTSEEKSEKSSLSNLNVNVNKSIGIRSNSKNAFMNGYIGQGVTQTNHSKSKTELDLENKFHPIPHITTTFSPKSTKSQSIGNKLIQNATKFVPLSTRGNEMTPNSFSTLSKKDNTQHVNLSNYNSNGPDNTNGNGNMEVINVMSLLGSQNTSPITLKNLNAAIPNYDNSKFSVKSMSVIKAYAANTHQGIIRYE